MKALNTNAFTHFGAMTSSRNVVRRPALRRLPSGSAALRDHNTLRHVGSPLFTTPFRHGYPQEFTVLRFHWDTSLLGVPLNPNVQAAGQDDAVSGVRIRVHVQACTKGQGWATLAQRRQGLSLR